MEGVGEAAEFTAGALLPSVREFAAGPRPSEPEVRACRCFLRWRKLCEVLLMSRAAYMSVAKAQNGREVRMQRTNSQC